MWVPVQDLARWMSAEPAKLAGMEGRKGAIAVGCDADLVVFDPEASFILQESALYYRHRVSPYLGEELYGKVMGDVFARRWCVPEKGYPRESLVILHETADPSAPLRSGRDDKGDLRFYRRLFLQTRIVGTSVPRKEAFGKLTGQARYIDDLSLPGMIFGATVRSSIARGAIEEIKFGEGTAVA